MFPKPKEPTLLELEINRTLTAMSNQSITSEEYAQMLEVSIKLHKIKADDKPDRLSKDTAAVIAANLLGIMMIIRHEHVNVITSRAMNLVLKSR